MKAQFLSLRTKGKSPLWTSLALFLAALVAGLLPFGFTVTVNRSPLIATYFEHPLIVVLNLFPVVFLAGLFYLLTNRAWIGQLVSGGLAAALGIVNYHKMLYRSEPLMFEDVLLFREAQDMAGKGYEMTFDVYIILAIAFVLLSALFLGLFASGRPEKKPRFIALAVCLLAFFPLLRLYQNENLYVNRTRNEALITPWAETQVFYSKGLVYPFLYSTRFAGSAKPADYRESAALQALNQYTDAPIPAESQIDVMTIMLEAYADFSGFGLPIDEAVYAPLRALQAESIHGELVTNIFAGGTVNTERAFLTGLSKMGNFRVPTNSYPWYFRENGYYVEGAHPSYTWFYNRRNIMENLGFENYYFVENRYEDIAYDGRFLPDLEKLYREHCAETDQPYFAYHLTYQGHGPYNLTEAERGEGYFGAGYSAAAYNAMNNYLGSLQNTGEHLLTLLGNLKDFERPLVVVLFGDHMPWMGDGNTIYEELGINLDLSTEEGFLNYYTTPYFIWANDKAKEQLGISFTGDGGKIAPCFLMTKLFDLCGWTGPAYMQATRPTMQAVPVPTDKGRYFLADGSMTLDQPAILQDFDSLQYYYLTHFRYEPLLVS